MVLLTLTELTVLCGGLYRTIILEVQVEVKRWSQNIKGSLYIQDDIQDEKEYIGVTLTYRDNIQP